MSNNRINSRKYIEGVRKRVEQECPGRFTQSDISLIYKHFIDELFSITTSGDILSLTGLGVFYSHKHKGHPVQFSKKAYIDDYYVLKFSASQAANRRLQKKIKSHRKK